MAEFGNYHICITGRQDTFTPSLTQVSRLIDMLDLDFYLEGSDRHTTAFVPTPSRDVRQWAQYVRENQDEPVKPLRRRYVHLTYSPIAIDQPYRDFNELSKIIESCPRDSAFIASLGRCTRRLEDILYCAIPDERRRWIESISAHLLQGYHPVWRRVWTEEVQHKEWELIAVKGFNLMFICKINPRAEAITLEEFIEALHLKDEFATFLIRIGKIVGCLDFEILGEASG